MVADLKDIQANATDPEHVQLASKTLDAYTFPVEMMVILSDGTVVHHVNANDLLDSQDGVTSMTGIFEDPMAEAYANFLKTGMTKAQELSAQQKIS